MVEPESPKARTSSRLIVIAVVLLLLVGAVIVLLDIKQVEQLVRHADWRYLIVALICVAASYFCGSASFVVIMRVFGTNLGRIHLLRIGLVSMVLENLIAHPAGLSLRILLLRRHKVSASQTVASSLLLAYFKNLLYLSLIPISLIYIVVSHPLPAFGIVTILLIIMLLVVLLVVASGIAFLPRVRDIALRGIGHVWHLVTRHNIQAALDGFSSAVTQGVNALRRHGTYRLPLAGFIVADVAATIAALWYCSAALVVPVHLGVLLTGFNFGITLTVISFIPGDMGVQEASMAGVFALFGVPFSHGVLVAILFRVLYYFVPFVASLGFYWRLLREKVND
jgi:uncharacterized protein (TIRG00374 family)